MSHRFDPARASPTGVSENWDARIRTLIGGTKNHRLAIRRHPSKEAVRAGFEPAYISRDRGAGTPSTLTNLEQLLLSAPADSCKMFLKNRTKGAGFKPAEFAVGQNSTETSVCLKPTLDSIMEKEGFEPSTCRLQTECSPTELHPRN